MEIENLAGLPAHPLVVHAAVVLVPLAALGTVVIALWPAARRRIGWIVVGLAVVGLIASWVAKESGESLEERVDEDEAVEEHAEMGDEFPLYAFLLAATSGGVMVVDHLRRRREDDPGPGGTGWVRPAAIGMSVLAVGASALGTYKVIEVGHSGAKATWEELDEGGEHGEAGTDDHEDEDD